MCNLYNCILFNELWWTCWMLWWMYLPPIYNSYFYTSVYVFKFNAFYITLWGLDCRIGDRLNEQICPRLLLTGWISFCNSPFCNLRDAETSFCKFCSLQISFHNSPFRNLQDSGCEMRLHRSLFLQRSIPHAGCGITISIFPWFRKFKPSASLILAGWFSAVDLFPNAKQIVTVDFRHGLSPSFDLL